MGDLGEAMRILHERKSSVGITADTPKIKEGHTEEILRLLLIGLDISVEELLEQAGVMVVTATTQLIKSYEDDLDNPVDPQDILKLIGATWIDGVLVGLISAKQKES